jgi:hypothetical protein
MLNMMEQDSSEHIVNAIFPGDSCFPLSPGPEDPEITNDNLDEFTFTQVAGKLFPMDNAESKVEIDQLD